MYDEMLIVYKIERFFFFNGSLNVQREGALFKTKWREGELLNLAKIRRKGKSKAPCFPTRRGEGELLKLAKAP